MNLELVAERLTPDLILDIGANVGHWAKAAQEYWPSAAFFLIEGNPNCQPMLQASGFSYAIAMLADKERNDVLFYTRKDAPTCTGASLYREQTEFYRDDNIVKTPVQLVTLDSIWNHSAVQYKTVLLKIDSQGSELDIMRGGPKVLAATKGVIVEVAHVEYNRGAPTDVDVHTFLDENGFSFKALIEKITHPLKPELHIQSSLFYMRP